ncbi:MAG: arginase family protein [Candidatus Dormibacteria bacterium]
MKKLLPLGEDRRAGQWLSGSELAAAELVFAGAPTSRLSISASHAEATPAALRAVLGRFPLWDAVAGLDLGAVRAHDSGDFEMDLGDAVSARGSLEEHLAALAGAVPGALLVLCGGDNSVTYAGVRAMARARGLELASGRVGLVTLDAHHDLRDPFPQPSNGSPVAELLADGLPGDRVAQLGIARHGNQRQLAERARAAGVQFVTAEEMHTHGWAAAALDAMQHMAAEHVYIDVDIDVLDRAFAPACPASLPGGARPADLLQAVQVLVADPRVRAIDIVEVDALADVADITLRCAASVLLAAAAGLAQRPH